MLLIPDIPDWLLIFVLIVVIACVLLLLGSAMIIEIRFLNPYLLIKATNRDKWHKGAILSVLQTAIIPILGLAAPIISPSPDQWMFIPVCSSIWIAFIPIATLFKRWEFERQIRNYQRLDKTNKE